MKYLKTFIYINESKSLINWDFVEEEEENDDINIKFQEIEKKILNHENIVLKIHIKYNNQLVNLLNKYSIRNLGTRYYNETNMVYFYIKDKDIAYMFNDKKTEYYNKRHGYNNIIEII